MVLFVYPMIGRPDKSLPVGWSEIPGARGCTVQALTYSDTYGELVRSGAQVFGVSRQSNDAQEEATRRLALKEPLLSDADGAFAAGLRLPEFTVGGKQYLRRLTLGVVAGTIDRIWYPVFPPGGEVSEVISWLSDLACKRKAG
jgi:peroxiredoxin